MEHQGRAMILSKDFLKALACGVVPWCGEVTGVDALPLISPALQARDVSYRKCPFISDCFCSDHVQIPSGVSPAMCQVITGPVARSPY